MSDGLEFISRENAPGLTGLRELTMRMNETESASASPGLSGGEGTNPFGGYKRLYSDYILSSSGNTITCGASDSKLVSILAEGIGWVDKTIESDITLSTVGFTNGKLHDIFINFNQDDAGILSAVEWTNETTRATALDTVDGVKLKNGDNTYRYLSTGRYNGSTMMLPKNDPNGELFFGTGDPRNNTTDPATGVGMSAAGWSIGGYIWQVMAILAGVVGVGFNNLGQLLAGAGAVLLDIAGITITASSAFSNTTSYKFTDGTNIFARWRAQSVSGNRASDIDMPGVSGADNAFGINVSRPTGQRATFDLTVGDMQGILHVEQDSAGNRVATLNHGIVDVDINVLGAGGQNVLYTDYGAVRVGIGTNAPANTLHVIGTAKVSGLVETPGGISSGAGVSLPNAEARTEARTMNDDTAYSFTPNKANGLIEIGTSATGYGGKFFYSTSAGQAWLLVGGANAAAATGSLAGTTGTDNRLTVSAHTDGKIYIENRSGGSRTVVWLLI